jgi:hypothetical protein
MLLACALPELFDEAFYMSPMRSNLEFKVMHSTTPVLGTVTVSRLSLLGIAKSACTHRNRKVQ